MSLSIVSTKHLKPEFTPPTLTQRMMERGPIPLSQIHACAREITGDYKVADEGFRRSLRRMAMERHKA